MRIVRLESETDFAGWRQAARALALEGVEPEYVDWRVGRSNDGLFAGDESVPAAPPPSAAFKVAPDFIRLAERVVLHRDPERFAVLYRLLWRLRAEPALLRIAVDADVARAEAMVKAVQRDMHKMKAFVRFREVDGDGGKRYIAWFEPTHHIVEATVPFFMRRFANMRWSILTPQISAHWTGDELVFGPGARRADAPAEDAGEDLWRSYYRSIFNPARLKVSAMQAQMPKKYWRNLPEAELIGPLIAQAPHRTGTMIREAPTEPRKRRLLEAGAALLPARDPAAPEGDAGEWRRLEREARNCRACPLWEPATQTVFGEGPTDARIMLIGEQPGDQEDLAGRPFIGPAGQLLDRALAEAGLDRSRMYVTNAVKHFKFEARGKRRLHSNPEDREIAACAQWLRREIELIRPRVIVALGSSAAQALLGQAPRIRELRGRPIALSAETNLLVTVHPSYVLRVPEAMREEAYRGLVNDLGRVGEGAETMLENDASSDMSAGLP